MRPETLPPPLSEKNVKEKLVADLAITRPPLPNGVINGIVDVIHTTSIPLIDRRQKDALKSIMKKVKEENIVVTKADKGNTVVLMDRSDYTTKVNECLTSIGAVPAPDFNFNKYNTAVRSQVNTSKYIFDKEPLKKAVLISNPIPPRLYGLPKVHKPGSPMRPVVSFISSPTYKIAKYLETWFKTITGFHAPLSVKNSIELSQFIIKNPPPPGSTLTSLDVIGLFPHVPLQPTRDRISELLQEAEVPPHLISEFQSLLQCCLAPNICQFNNTIYKLPTEIGIPIGSPLGSLISEVFMSKLESDIFHSELPPPSSVTFPYGGDMSTTSYVSGLVPPSNSKTS